MGDRMTVVSPNRCDEGQKFPALARQNSLYSLTLDEVQSQLGNVGKPLNCMNFDELLKNVLSVEEGQLVQNPSSSSSSSSPFVLGNINLNGTLSKKTVDEVWKEIVHHDQQHLNGVYSQSVQQQLTLGETTLEDFLVRAGVINIWNQNCILDSQPLMSIDPMVVMSQQADWLQFQMSAAQQQEQQQQMMVMDSSFDVSESVYENPVVDVGYSENQLGISMPLQAISSAITPSESQAEAAEKKRRFSEEMMEKTIERRQKRMIKNRESAARSRARKQAYTNQLEHEVFHLRKKNSFLKRQKEVEMMLSSDQTSGIKYQLRRTSSAPF